MKLTLRGKAFLAVLSSLFIFSLIALSVRTGFATKKDSLVNYEFYTVKSTDTLWSIACEHTSKDKDVRQTIYELKKLNHINENELTPGMRLAVFK